MLFFFGTDIVKQQNISTFIYLFFDVGGPRKTKLLPLGFCDRASWANCEVREKTNKMQQLDVYYQHFLNMFQASLLSNPPQCSHPTTQRPTTATNHIQQNQRSTPRSVTHVLFS